MARTGSCNHSPPQQAHTQLQQLSPGHLHLHNEGFSGMLHLRWSVNTLCKHALEKTPEADSSCFAQPAHSPAAHHCEQGSNPKWLIQDHPHATGWQELGKLDQAVVRSLEGRQGYVGWDISSSLKHRW